jgi:hypothetical protein
MVQQALQSAGSVRKILLSDATSMASRLEIDPRRANSRLFQRDSPSAPAPNADVKRAPGAVRRLTASRTNDLPPCGSLYLALQYERCSNEFV